PPDEYSGLFGSALLARKIKQIVVVGGFFPDSHGGAEYNFFSDIEATRVLNSMTNSIPTMFVGIEEGDTVIIPAQGVSRLQANSPVRYVFEYFHATNRQSWGGVGFLYAARGEAWRGTRYFQTSRGRVSIDENGADKFELDPAGNQAYVQKTQPDEHFVE